MARDHQRRVASLVLALARGTVMDQQCDDVGVVSIAAGVMERRLAPFVLRTDVDLVRACDALLNHSYSGALENIFVNAKVHELLLYSLDCLVDEKEEGFTCKFLADEADAIVFTRPVKFYCNISAILSLSKNSVVK